VILRPVLHLSAGLAIAAALSGCALLSTPDPVQNYRFGLPMAAPSAVGDTPAAFLKSAEAEAAIWKQTIERGKLAVD